jgi:hypothetical protein
MEVTDAEDGGSTDLEITSLAGEHQRYPDELEGAAWYRPDHINQHLGLVRSFAH